MFSHGHILKTMKKVISFFFHKTYYFDLGLNYRQHFIRYTLILKNIKVKKNKDHIYFNASSKLTFW